MNSKKIAKLTFVALSVAGGGALVVKLAERNTSKTEVIEQSRFEQQKKWDFNWDKREPSALIKPKSKRLDRLKEEKSLVQIGEHSSAGDAELEKKYSSQATRHLFFIRHGQYELKENDNEKKVLTELGNNLYII